MVSGRSDPSSSKGPSPMNIISSTSACSSLRGHLCLWCAPPQPLFSNNFYVLLRTRIVEGVRCAMRVVLDIQPPVASHLLKRDRNGISGERDHYLSEAEEAR